MIAWRGGRKREGERDDGISRGVENQKKGGISELEKCRGEGRMGFNGRERRVVWIMGQRSGVCSMSGGQDDGTEFWRAMGSRQSKTNVDTPKNLPGASLASFQSPTETPVSASAPRFFEHYPIREICPPKALGTLGYSPAPIPRAWARCVLR